MKIKKAMRILAMLVIFSILLATTIFAAPARASAYLSAYYAKHNEDIVRRSEHPFSSDCPSYNGSAWC